MVWTKLHREREKWTHSDAFVQVARRLPFLTIARTGLAFFVIIMCGIFDDFERFLCPWRKQSNPESDINERVLAHFRTSSDDVHFEPLQDRLSYFLMVILRWFSVHFGIILHDFGLPFGSLISVYEWSSEHVKTRNFHHFLKHFWARKIELQANALWFSWKILIKLERKKDSFWGHSFPGIVLCDFFTRLPKKRDYGHDLQVGVIKFRPSAHT